MTGHAIHTRVLCEHMDVTGVSEAYCSLCLANIRHELGCDDVTARFAMALHHGWVKGDVDA